MNGFTTICPRSTLATSRRSGRDADAVFHQPGGDPVRRPDVASRTGTFDFYLKVMRRPDLAEDPRFLTPALRKQNLAALDDIVQKWIFTFEDMASLDAQFDEAKLATGTVREIKDFAKTDWAQSWGATRSVSDRQGGEITIPGPPWHFSAHDDALPPQVPALQGEHNWEILREIGLSDDDIEQPTNCLH